MPKNTNVSSNSDNVKSRNIVILKAITSLIEKVTNELEERSTALESLNKKNRYNSMHDSLTGLYNRNYYEDLIQNFETIRDKLLGLFICDVDGLKLINDRLGHNIGDTILKETASILKSTFHPDSVVARIGGDEFVVLLSKKSLLNSKSAFKKIHEAVDNYNSSNPKIPLSLSLGYSDFINSDINITFNKADKAMYREKFKHKKLFSRRNLLKTLMK